MYLKKNNIQLAKMMMFTSDGAEDMMGKHDRVQAKIKVPRAVLGFSSLCCARIVGFAVC